MSTGEGGGYAVGRRRRERILEIATRRFAESGYSSVSMAAIARDAGLTTPGLLHHFPTKQHLLLAVADHRFDLASGLASSAPHGDDGLGALRTMLLITRQFVSQPGLIELFVALSAEAADPSTAAHELFRARYERVTGELVARFEEGVATGRLRPDLDYAAVARECIALADGLQLQFVLSARRLDLVAGIRTHLERLAREIVATPGEIRLDVDDV